ncbi:hypothetical protein NDU88_002508 [Pleurodeles waltl]|uniref:Uncharacterized protein n=1 Tax=Pleurodeles waltl TaxID=8319 RepID=A0AAV7T260_PLEWA|nr:hypothetical protein NDU88_002508 [Pleurodeles waltl]
MRLPSRESQGQQGCPAGMGGALMRLRSRESQRPHGGVAGTGASVRLRSRPRATTMGRGTGRSEEPPMRFPLLRAAAPLPDDMPAHDQVRNPPSPALPGCGGERTKASAWGHSSPWGHYTERNQSGLRSPVPRGHSTKRVRTR